MKREVNTLLQLMDAFRGKSLLIAATNHETLPNKGVWRRFEAVVQFPVPAPQDRIHLLRQFLRGFDATALNLESLAGKLDGASGADIERLCVEAARLALLGGRNSLSREDVQVALDSYRERSKITLDLIRQIEE